MLAALLLSIALASPPPTPPLVNLAPGAANLRKAFEAGRGKVRLVVLLSPT